MEAGEEFTAKLLRVLEERVVDRSLLREGSSTLASMLSRGLDERLVEYVVERRLDVASTIALSRLREFMERGDCRGLTVDRETCELVVRLVRGYTHLLAGLVFLDEAGRVYVRVLRDTVVDGRRVPRGAIIAVDPGHALVLYASGDARVATIKPIS